MHVENIYIHIERVMLHNRSFNYDNFTVIPYHNYIFKYKSVLKPLSWTVTKIVNSKYRNFSGFIVLHEDLLFRLSYWIDLREKEYF